MNIVEVEVPVTEEVEEKLKDRITDKVAEFVRERVLSVALGKGGRDIEKTDITDVMQNELLMITFEAGMRTDMMTHDLTEAEKDEFVELHRIDDEGGFITEMAPGMNMVMFALTDKGVEEVFPKVKHDLKETLLRLVGVVDSL